MKIIILILIASSSLGCTYGHSNERSLEFVKDQSNDLQIEIMNIEVNRIYFIDKFNNINFLTNGINKFSLEDDFFQLIDGTYKISYVLRKGENVQISKKGKFVFLDFKNKKRNLELEFYTKFFQRFEEKTYNQWSFQQAKLESKYILNPDLRDKEFMAEILLQKDFIQKYQVDNMLNLDFLEFNQSYFDYKVINKILFLNGKSEKFKPSYLNNVNERYNDFFSKEAFLVFDSYRNSLFSHALFNLANNLDAKEVVKCLKAKYSNSTLYWVILNLILVEKSDFPIFNFSKLDEEYLFKFFYENCKNKEFINYLNDAIYIDNKIFKNGEILGINMESIMLDSLLTERYSYLDFWASWCGPCRAEMPASVRLEREFKRKGINFVYISLDDNPSAWKKAVTFIGNDRTSNFLLPKGFKSELARKFKISSIPKYVIIDKNGKILNINAPRPSDPNIKLIFNELLKE